MKITQIPVGALGTNCYFLEDEETREAAFIDPGDNAPYLLSVLKKSGARLRYILITHGHYDHTSAVPELKAALPEVEIYIHQGDANGAGSTLFPLADEVDDLLLYGDGDQLTLGGLTIEVLHTPGHSPGSVTLKVGDVLFTGDTLFCGSCGRTDLRGGSYEQIMGSLKRLAQLPGDYQVCPGHDITSTMERERRTNPFLLEALRQ